MLGGCSIETGRQSKEREVPHGGKGGHIKVDSLLGKGQTDRHPRSINSFNFTTHPPKHFTMSFHLTGQDIRVENDHVLVALLQNENGDYVESSIDLNQFVGNDNGMLQQTVLCGQ